MDGLAEGQKKGLGPKPQFTSVLLGRGCETLLFMQAHGTPRRRTILLFTWAAGSVDAITYIVAHVFTANMTGNAVLLGISVGQGVARAAVHSLVALVAFMAGIILGAVLVGEQGHGIPWIGIRISAVVETIVLALFAAVFFLRAPLGPNAFVYLAIILSGFAMGMQSATVKRLNLPGIATTYITGTMTSLVSGLVHHWGPGEVDDEDEDFSGIERSLWLQAWVFILYALSAIASGLLHKSWPAGVALLPLVAIVLVTISVYVMHPPKRQ
jgi:uncharacterized membrane protein YoaK (UPF0700 family)